MQQIDFSFLSICKLAIATVITLFLFTPVQLQTQNSSYVYDLFNRLVEVHYPDKIIHYTYDAAGNRTGMTVENLAAVPSITNLNPNNAAIGGSSFTLIVTGSNFTNNSIVKWNGANRTTTFNSANQLSASIPASDTAAVGTAAVTVFNQNTNSTSNAQTFTTQSVVGNIIFGNITSGATALTNVTVNLSGSSTASTTTDAGGDYSFAGLANGGNYTVTPSLTNYTFTPPTATFSNLSANQTANFVATLNCSFSINPTAASVTSSSGTGSFAVTAPVGCSWTASTTANWITVTSGSSGSGNGSVGYSIAANSGATRSGIITAAGQTFTINQDAAAPNYEADVQTRPGGDGFVDSDDIQEIRRFVVGLDQPYQSNEFQRADCSPRSTQGDGFIDSDDVQQARRYSVGTDAVQNANGPASGSIAPQLDWINLTENLLNNKSTVRTTEPILTAPAFRVGSQNTSAGQTVTIPILVDTAGNEASYTFSLNYDSSKLINPKVVIGNAGGDVVFNTNTAGQIGFSVTSFSSGTIAAGTNKVLINVTFTVPANVQAGITTLSFTDTLAKRKTSGSDPNIPIQQPTYTGGIVTIGAATVERATVAGRVTTQSGRSIRNVIINLMDSQGNSRTLITNSFGYFEFKDVAVGETYTLEAKAKLYTFSQPTLVVNVDQNLTEINFTALP